MKKIIAILLTFSFIATTVFAAPIMPWQGGTGTTTAPTFGDMLIGNSIGVYDVRATSTLGISGIPGGSDSHVQYNDGGVFGGSAFFIFDDINNRVGIGTTSPYAVLSVVGPSGIVADHYTATSSIATSTATSRSSA